MEKQSINWCGKNSLPSSFLSQQKPLTSAFFAQDTTRVARELIGTTLVRQLPNGKQFYGRIVETEAYLEHDDPAAHCARGPTPRCSVMFGPPGFIYIYFIYGVHFMLNFVTEPEGTAGAVLIRALEPLGKVDDWSPLPKGPGKLTKALAIDLSLNRQALQLPYLAVFEKEEKVDLITTTRIGIRVGQDLHLRFYEKGNAYVSRT